MFNLRRRSVVAFLAAIGLLASLTPLASAEPETIPTTLTIEASPNPAWVGELVTVTFRVTPIPDGGAITMGGPSYPIDPTTGTYVLEDTFDRAGTYIIGAWYTGTATYEQSSVVDYPLELRQHPVAATLEVPAEPVGRGDPFDITVDLDEAPDGGRLFIHEMADDGGPGPSLKVVDVTGPQPMTISMPGMEPGEYLLQAFFAGTNGYAPATSAELPVTVFDRPTTTTITTSPNPSLFGQPIEVSVSVTPIPDDGGLVSIHLDGSTMAWLDMDWETGIGATTLGPTDPGTHVISAEFVATGRNVQRWASSSASRTHIVSTTPIESDPPAGTIEINGGAERTATSYVVLSMHATDSSRIVATHLSCDAVTWLSAGTVDGDYGWAFGNADAGCHQNDGVNTIHVRWRDAWGNIGYASDSIILDVNAPIGSVVLQGGDPFTTSDTITVAVGATDAGSSVSSVALSNNGSDWTVMPYAPTVDWSLVTGEPSEGLTAARVADGSKTVHVKWRDASDHWSSPKTDSIVLDRTAPVGAVAIADGAPYTNSARVVVSVAAIDTASAISLVALSNDGSTWTTLGYTASHTWTLPTGNGQRTVYVKWRDGAGNWSAVKSDTIVLDTTPPTTAAPERSLVSGTAISVGRVMNRLTWAGADATSGVVRFDLQQSTDGGQWTTVAAGLTEPTLDRSLAAQHLYAFRVRAVDAAGNVGAWATSASGRVARYNETSRSIAYTGSWKRISNAKLWTGHSRVSSAAGAKASLTFTGRSVAFVSRLGPTRGKARIYLDGKLVATLDLRANTNKYQRVMWVRNFSTSSRHTIIVKVVGTGGRPWVDVDAFVVGT